MLSLEEVAHERFDGRIQTFVQRSPRYLGTMCEILRHDANKWTAILHLARLWGIGPSAICAVGDDVNDIPMIKNAGLGVAMGHARLEVRSAADLVTGDHDEDGVAMLVDEVLLGEGTRD
jgi:5-amino-6-(5-phospho-D-ribitylamino)uracil phosphatase